MYSEIIYIRSKIVGWNYSMSLETHICVHLEEWYRFHLLKGSGLGQRRAYLLELNSLECHHRSGDTPARWFIRFLTSPSDMVAKSILPVYFSPSYLKGYLCLIWVYSFNQNHSGIYADFSTFTQRFIFSHCWLDSTFLSAKNVF